MIQLAGTHSVGLLLGPFNGTKYLSEIVRPNLVKALGRGDFPAMFNAVTDDMVAALS